VLERHSLNVPERQLKKPLAEPAEEIGRAGREEPRHTLATEVVLDPLPRECLGDLPGGLLRREDERDSATEDPLEDRTDERIVRAPENDRVNPGLLQRGGVRANGLGGLGAERRLALDQRHESRAGHGHEGDARVERVHQLGVAAGGHGRLGREQPDPAVARRLYGRMGLGRDHADHRKRHLLLQLPERGRGGGVAGDEDQLDILGFEECRDLARKAANLRQRTRAVRQAGVIAEVEEVLVRHRHEALVEDGKTAHTRVEDADRPPVHGGDSTALPGDVYVAGVGRLLAVVVLALVLAPAADPFTKTDLRLRMSDGVELAATLYVPDGLRPGAGWPAVMAFHGLGQTRASMNAIAEAYFVPRGYAVLTVDARGHGESGGLSGLDSPREVQDVAELFAWLASRGDVDATRIGAVGVSLGGGLVWRAAATGVPFAAIVPITTWTDFYGALFPGNLAKSGVIVRVLNEIPADRWSPDVTGLESDLLHSTNLARVRTLANERSVAGLLGRVRAPALVIQGRRDFEFDLGQAEAALRGLHGRVHLYLGDVGHPPAPNPPAELPHVYGLVGRWLDRWLRGIQNGVDRGPPVELAPDPWTGRTFRYKSLPPTRSFQLSFPGRKTVDAAGELVRTVRLPDRRLETFGAPVLRVTASSATGWPRLVAQLTALTPQGKIVVADGGLATPTIGPRTRQLTLRLTNQSTLIRPRSRLRLTLGSSSSDLLYLHFPLPQDVKVTISRVRLTLPVLRRPVSR
jgi:fermentation-respiration switch protein FrsA (DUF1100 family)